MYVSRVMRVVASRKRSFLAPARGGPCHPIERVVSWWAVTGAGVDDHRGAALWQQPLNAVRLGDPVDSRSKHGRSPRCPSNGWNSAFSEDSRRLQSACCDVRGASWQTALPGRRARWKRPRFGHLRQDEAESVRANRRRSVLVGLPESATTREVVAAIEDLSADERIDGILLQHPVPEAVDERAAFEAIVPDKDVDGVTKDSFASMAFGLPSFASCTPAGIMRLLDEYDVRSSGKHAVVIGRSPILGKPMGMLLLARDATVTYCHSRTEDLPTIVRTADIVVAAVGRPDFVRGDWIKPGAVVIDAGYNEGNVGDVAYSEAVSVAGLIDTRSWWSRTQPRSPS